MPKDKKSGTPKKDPVIKLVQPKSRGIKAKNAEDAPAVVKRTYSDRDKGAALALLDFNRGVVETTAKALGIPASTLAEWRDGRVTPDVKVEAEGARRDLRAKCEDAAHEMLNRITERATAGMGYNESLKDWTMSFAIMVDKMQLLNGDPTVITATTAADRKAEYEALVTRVLKRAVDSGKPATREDVVRMIVERKPEAKEYLM